MNHFATAEFWDLYNELPEEVQKLADKNYQLLSENPRHPSLHFKKLKDDLFSIRVGLSYRALATVVDSDFVWFWIGSHSQYDQLVR